jgi:AraC family transcriptional regulator
MLGGAFQSEIAHRRLDCPAATAWVEPLAERHANYIGRKGARVLVVQPDPDDAALFGPFASFLQEVRHLRHAGIAADALRVSAELTIADDVSTLAIDGLVQTMLATAARTERRSRTHAPTPRWILQAQESLHARFRNRVSITDLAGEVGVSPWHLARGFRKHLRASPSDYVRQLRVAWAAEQLVFTDTPLAEIAIAAGFSDQSHLTRECRRQLGVTPLVYRRAARPVSGFPCTNGNGEPHD